MANTSKGKRHTSVIRLPEDLYEVMATEAQNGGISLNAYMIRLMILGRKMERELCHAGLRSAEQTASR